MERLLSQIFRYIPDWVFVMLLLAGALAYFMYDKPIYKLCNAQISAFFAGQTKKLGAVTQARKACIQSIRGAGCLNYFRIYESAVYDFNKVDLQCRPAFAENTFITNSMSQYLATMAQLAWGDRPPTTQFEKVSWLTPAELKVFCKVREFYRANYTVEKWDGLVSATLSALVEDPKALQKSALAENQKAAQAAGSPRVQERLAQMDEKQKAEEDEKKAEYVFPKAKMSLSKAYDLSLFSLDCMPYM